MGTTTSHDSLTPALFGKTRTAVLGLLFSHADESFYLRQIVRRTGIGLGAAQRELRQLTQSGIVRREARGNQVYYQADKHCPAFSEIKSLVMKTAGSVSVIASALSPLADRIDVAFIFGSIATSSERSASDVDVLIIGRVDFEHIAAATGSTGRRDVRLLFTHALFHTHSTSLTAAPETSSFFRSGKKTGMVSPDYGLCRLKRWYKNNVTGNNHFISIPFLKISAARGSDSLKSSGR